MIKTPKFWYSEKQSALLISWMLFPISLLWRLLFKVKLFGAKHKKFGVPIICVGNINVGGSGKTPTVIALTELLLNKGVGTHVVSKGYKGKNKGPKKVEPGDTAEEMGDEPILLATHTNVWVSKNRVKGINAAIKNGAEVVLLDDGFQDLNVCKSLSIVTVDAEMGFGNKKVLPSGPLRENLTSGLDRADAILVIGNDLSRKAFLANQNLPEKLVVFNGELNPICTGINFKNSRFLAAAGIAHPEKFFRTLEKCGANIVKKVPLPDHVNLSYTLIKRLKNMAIKENAQLIVTEKDAVRIPKTERLNVVSLPVRLTVYEQDELMKLISSKGVSVF